MEYVRIYWEKPFTLEELQKKHFAYNVRFNFYILTTLDKYHDYEIKYIGKTTHAIINRLENHHKWDEIKDTIKNPLKDRISLLIQERPRMKLFIESLVEKLENNQPRLAQIITGLQENHIYIFIGQGMISRRPFSARVFNEFRPAPNIRSNPIPIDYIDPIENALIFSIQPEFNEKLKLKYLHTDKKIRIRNISGPIQYNIDTRKFGSGTIK